MNIENISLFSAFLGGFFSVLNPGVLIMIPAYLAYLSGSNPLVKLTRIRILIFILYVLMFWGGFALIFVILYGSPDSYIGKNLFSLKHVMSKLGGLFLILFAVYVGIRTLLHKSFAAILSPIIDIILTAINFVRSAFIGMVFAASIALIVTPVIAAILTLSMEGQHADRVTFYLLVYAIGLAIPLIMVALLLMVVTYCLRNMNQNLGVIEHIVSSLVLFIYGLILLTGIFELLL